jgi:hypothetical protein
MINYQVSRKQTNTKTFTQKRLTKKKKRKATNMVKRKELNLIKMKEMI